MRKLFVEAPQLGLIRLALANRRKSLLSVVSELNGEAIGNAVESRNCDVLVSQGQFRPEDSSIDRDGKTGDKKYDKEGDRPFFDHWRRVSASPKGLTKIQRTFGRDIRERCYRHKVTGVWSDTPKPDSLIFLDPVAAIRQMPI
ncbi:hypothetical protein P5Y53_16205 [Dyella jiangningensis]|nr:hypothetical protein [Dyella jiangningensis]